MSDDRGYEVDRAVDWVTFGAAWYYLVWPEYLVIAWGPTALTVLVDNLHTHFHAAIAWGICTSAVFLLSMIFRKLGAVLAFLLASAWGAGGGFLAFFLAGHWYWGVMGGLVVMVVAWVIHAAALMMPERA